MSEKRGSNPRPRPWQGRALPTELFSHYQFLLEQQYLSRIADANVTLKMNIANLFREKNSIFYNPLIAKRIELIFSTTFFSVRSISSMLPLALAY